MTSSTRLIFFNLFCTIALFFSQAQTDADITAKYLKAKDLLFSSKYEESIKLFTELGSKTVNNEFAASCKYFAAYGFYKKSNFKDANFLLYQIINKYPNWEKIDMVYYLKGVVQLESRNYADGFAQFSKISQRTYRKKVDATTSFYQGRLSTDSLRMLAERFSDNKVLKNSFSSRTNIYYTNIEVLLKPEWNVALLLPLEAMAKNGFVYELQAGIALAIDSLANRGVKVNLHTFDSGKDSSGVINFTSMPDAGCFDMVIGPLYSNQQKFINEYSIKYTVPVVNPLSTSFALGGQNPNYFLFQPSSETQGRSAAEFAFANFTRMQTSVVIYGTAANDSLIAKAYKLRFEQLGGKVLKYKLLNKNSSAYFGAVLAKTPIDSVGHVFISSNESSLAANVFTSLEALLTEKASSYKETLVNKEKTEETNKKLSVADVPVFTSGKWLEIESISYEQFMMHNTHLLQIEYAETDINAKHFERKYYDRYEIPASTYAKQGYGLMLVFGNYLGVYGVNFPAFLINTKTEKCPALGYYNYSKGRDNGFVAITKIENFQLKLANKPDLQK